MYVKHFKDLPEITALDGTTLKEFLNPHHQEKNLTLGYSLAHATLESKKASQPHRFKEASEVYYIIKGQGRMHINNTTSKVGPGDVIYIPPQAIQHIENVGEERLEFLCIVYPAWQPNAEELV